MKYLIFLIPILFSCSGINEQLESEFNKVNKRLKAIESSLEDLKNQSREIRSNTKVIADTIGSFKSYIINAKKVKIYK